MSASETTVRVVAAIDTIQRTISTASGIVQPKTAVDIAFQVAGKVATVGPDEGSLVRAGEVLATLEPTDYRLAFEQLQSQSDRAVQERDRYRPLLAAGSVSINDMERLEALVRQSSAASLLARKHLGDTHLTSPMHGIIAKRAIEPGATIAPGQPMFTIMNIDSVRVRIGVPEAEVGGMQVGQAASVTTPALGEALFHGTVSLVGIAADPTTRSYSVEITVPNGTRQLKPGMVAEAKVTGRVSRHFVSVPASAIMHRATDAAFVFVYDPHDRVVRERAVKTGGVQGDAIEIASGLVAGELAVVAGQQRVQNGSAVRLASAPSKAGVR